MSHRRDETRARRASERRGRAAEWIAAAYLTAKGYRVLGQRVRTPAGEIDLVAVRGTRLAFVEVKQRQSDDAAEAAVTGRQAMRVRHASDLWLGRNTRYQTCEIHFDLILVMPWALPRHVEDGL